MTTRNKVIVLLSNAYSMDPRVRRECESLQRAGFSVRVLAWDREGTCLKSETINLVEVERFGMKSTSGQGMRQLGNLIRFWLWCIWRGFHHQFHFIHCNDLDTLLPGWIVGRIRGASVIFDAHEHFPSQMKNSSGSIAIRFANFLEKFLVRRVDAVITVGHRLAKFLSDEGAKKVEVVFNSRDKENFQFESKLLDNWKAALGLADKKLVITCMGALASGRHLDILMDAVSKKSEIGLILAGNGAMKPLVIDYAKQYRNILYLGFIPEELVLILTSMGDAIYNGFNASMPNTYFSMPNKLFHALAAQKPLMVTRRVGEIGEVVEQFGLGPMLEAVNEEQISDALNLLLDPDCYREYLKNLEKAFSDIYSWKSSQTRLVNLYQSLNTEKSQ